MSNTTDEFCSEKYMFNIENYSAVNVQSPHPQSTRFATVNSNWTCMRSEGFWVSNGGVLEVTAFMNATSLTDHVWIEVRQNFFGGCDFLVGLGALLPSRNPTWQTIRVTVEHDSSAVFRGYIVLWGRAAPQSLVMIDSFRYISRSTDEADCLAYDNN
ncbi:uncharacterized protein LOC112054563 [Bicyclus anynana]|uniref:Uncharacterized protein LOC112054563 n=1 Tax=Bicyclus anynana TaxID=110368 RepID=A0A6J1NZC6_BICAN|nr:uncharacterized protein LOC112054563 [Bicyclus anynana]